MTSAGTIHEFAPADPDVPVGRPAGPIRKMAVYLGLVNVDEDDESAPGIAESFPDYDNPVVRGVAPDAPQEQQNEG